MRVWIALRDSAICSSSRSTGETNREDVTDRQSSLSKALRGTKLQVSHLSHLTHHINNEQRTHYRRTTPAALHGSGRQNRGEARTQEEEILLPKEGDTRGRRPGRSPPRGSRRGRLPRRLRLGPRGGVPPAVRLAPAPPARGGSSGWPRFIQTDGLINLDAGGSDEDDGEPSSGGPDVEPAADCCQVEDEYELPRQPSDCLDPDPQLPEKRIRIRRDLYVAKPATPTKPGRHRSCPRARRRHKGKKERTETTTVPTKGWVAGPLYMEFGPKDGRGS